MLISVISHKFSNSRCISLFNDESLGLYSIFVFVCVEAVAAPAVLVAEKAGLEALAIGLQALRLHAVAFEVLHVCGFLPEDERCDFILDLLIFLHSLETFSSSSYGWFLRILMLGGV
jgi:hypothetical protein